MENINELNKAWARLRLPALDNSDNQLEGIIEGFYSRLQHLDGQAEIDEIRSNHLLSERGQAEEIEALTEKRAANLKGFIEEIRLEVLTSALHVDSLKRMNDLLEKDFKTWDYNRLAYEAKGVESEIAIAAGDWDMLGMALEMAKQSGDDHKAKAWRDVAPALLPKEQKPDKFGINQDFISEQKAQFLASLQEAEIITLSAEQKSHYKEAEGLKDNLAAFHAIASEIDAISVRTGGGKLYTEHIFKGVNLPSNPMVPDIQDDEKPAQYMKRKAEEVKVERAAYEAEAAKMGVEIDWTRQALPESA